jgi:hypothetical protein
MCSPSQGYYSSQANPTLPTTDLNPNQPNKTNYARAREISEGIAVVVYGPDGPDTDDCANAWEVAKALARIEAHLGIKIINPPGD